MQPVERSHWVVVLSALLLWTAATATPVTPAYNCPVNCTCNLAQNTHRPLLHAKCSSINGLNALEEPLNTEVPLHSIDLSYLGLTRIGHALDALPSLTSVDLSHNELHDIGHLRSKRIKKLNLRHNRLTSSKLAKLPQHLQVLNLQHNDITNLPMALTHLHHLQHLELSHNDINCSCETLEVRNWLQERNVYMEQAVVCSHPAEARGKPWLQLKQSEICEKEQRGWYASDIDENELMMGDQPLADSEESEHDDEEELGKSYMPINSKKSNEQALVDDVEGSGDLSERNMPIQLGDQSVAGTTIQPIALEEEQNDEGSGSGDSPLILVPSIVRDPIDTDDFEAPDTQHHSDDDENFDNKPVEEPAAPSPDIFKPLGIYNSGEAQPASEESIVPVVHTQYLDAKSPSEVITDAPLDADGAESEDILTAKMAKKDDGNATYFLLGVIGLIVVGLILFVAIKRCKYNSNAARDAEAQRQTELLDMDKKNLGKPLHRNGNEQAPLIAEKSKVDQAQPTNGAGKKPYDSQDAKDGAGQQPLLNGNGGAKEVPTINEPADEMAPHEYYPVTPRYPTPQSPRASKYAQHPQGDEQNNNNEPDAAYLPSSPKSGRYSPVYSPETGRVKIKLTETPKPKTPMLVTRSKSNAGDIITTPVRAGDSYQTTDPALLQPAVHQPVALAAGGAANGHVGH